MKYGINPFSILPVRAEPDSKSEMVSQLLFGEQFIVLDEKNNWQHVQCALDGYQGWITINNTQPVNNFPLLGEINPDEVICQLGRISMEGSPENSFFILPGSTLPGLDPKTGKFRIEETGYQFHGEIRIKEKKCTGTDILEAALIFLNAPYLWGGRNLFGIDCSGLAQLVYKMCGIAIPRDAAQQVRDGVAISFASDARPGDLAFFADPEEEISHVGIIMDKGRIIHASGKVRIDSFDHQGIFNRDTQNYSHYLRVIHRYLEE